MPLSTGATGTAALGVGSGSGSGWGACSCEACSCEAGSCGCCCCGSGFCGSVSCAFGSCGAGSCASGFCGSCVCGSGCGPFSASGAGCTVSPPACSIGFPFESLMCTVGILLTSSGLSLGFPSVVLTHLRKADDVPATSQHGSTLGNPPVGTLCELLRRNWPDATAASNPSSWITDATLCRRLASAAPPCLPNLYSFTSPACPKPLNFATHAAALGGSSIFPPGT
mmetsp:Transcript_7211/g.25404  ORF Transcript_7211/g.25404 Transcript_7211/m.25404 type:complete len:225 (-) Transcript_7211:856-1530(-)